MNLDIDSGTKVVSIIVPMYNAEKFIARCIESVLRQTCPNWELILVNDGSKDASLNIAQNFERKDDRIKVYNGPNEGVSCARNKGIEIASGQIIVFVDADDWISNYYIEKILSNWDENTDVIVFDYFEATSCENYRRLCGFKKEEFKDDRDNFFLLSLLGYYDRVNEKKIYRIGSPWGKAYSASLLEENIRFPSGVMYGEDRLFNICFFKNAKHIKYVEEGVYFYYLNPNSVVRQIQYNIAGLEESYECIIELGYNQLKGLIEEDKQMCVAWNKFVLSRMKECISKKALLYGGNTSNEKDNFLEKYAIYLKDKKHCQGLSFIERVIVNACAYNKEAYIIKFLRMKK